MFMQPSVDVEVVSRPSPHSLSAVVQGRGAFRPAVDPSGIMSLLEVFTPRTFFIESSNIGELWKLFWWKSIATKYFQQTYSLLFTRNLPRSRFQQPVSVQRPGSSFWNRNIKRTWTDDYRKLIATVLQETAHNWKRRSYKPLNEGHCCPLFISILYYSNV